MAEACGHFSQKARHLLRVFVDGAIGHASPGHQQQLFAKLLLLSDKTVDLGRRQVRVLRVSAKLLLLSDKTEISSED